MEKLHCKHTYSHTLEEPPPVEEKETLEKGIIVEGEKGRLEGEIL